MSVFLFLMLLLECVLMLVIFIISGIAIYCMISSKFMLNPPPIPSCGKVKIAMIEDVAKLLRKRKNQLVMDLGSGWGDLLLPLAKRFPSHRFVGVERNFLPYWVSRFRSRKLKNITFYRQNLFNTNISEADVIFLFLLNRTMSKIVHKYKTEAKTGAYVYSNRFPMPDVKGERKVILGSGYDTYYVYKK